MDEKISRVITALEKNNMRGIYAETVEDVKNTVRKMLFDGCTITAGGSVSVAESGVWDIINEEKYNFADRNRAGITPDEQQEVFRSAIGCDFFFCSSNAITENGELVNVDGFANRITALTFGPKNVIVIAGANKIVKDTTEGFLRIKRTVAPKNCVRLGIDNPCVKLGHCVSLLKSDNPAMTDGCNAPRRICRNYIVTGPQAIKDRITVIICKENLGY